MKNEKDFFKGIEDTLHAYEDAYVPGAWEAFQQKRDRKPAGMLFLKIGSAAAVLLLVAYASFMAWDKEDATTKLAANKPTMQQPANKSVPSSTPQIVQPSAVSDSVSSANQPQIAANNQAENNKLSKNHSSINNNPVKPANTIIATVRQSPAVNDNSKLNHSVTIKPDTALMAKNNIPTIKKDPISVAVKDPAAQNVAVDKPTAGNTIDKVIANNNVNKPTNTSKPSYDDLVRNKSSKVVAAATDKSNNERSLSYSVLVQPGIGNQKINMGTGVQVAYKLSDKISVTSGISYSSLSATGSGSAASARLGGVQNVNLAVSGVEIPLGIQYKTDKGYYVSAAVMGMSVTSNSMQYNYIEQSTVASPMFDKSGMSYSGLSVESRNATAESKEKVANYLGFYILSAGRKYPIGKKNSLILGPFMRVPFGAVSSEKIRLLQGGVTVGLGF